MTASEEICRAVVDYLDWRIWGLLFSFPFLALRAFLVGITKTKALNVAALTAVLVNIPCNWLLIFRMDMGIAGAAAASSFAELCSLAVLSVHVLRKMDRQHYGLHCRPDTGILRQVIKVSQWSMFHSFIGVASWLAFFVAIEHLGGLELAATTGSLTSNLIGSGHGDGIFRLCGRVIRLGYAIGFPLIVLVLCMYRPIMGIYTDNAGLIQIARWPFAVMLLDYIFALPGYVLMNTVTGTGATRMTFIFQLTTIAAYQIYLWSISSLSTSLSVFWTAEYLYVILLGVQSFVYLRRTLRCGISSRVNSPAID